MSDAKNEENQGNAENTENTENSEAKEEYVSRKVAEDFKSDMFKYKDRSKSLEAQNNELTMKLEAIERDKLEKNSEWEKLYQQEKDARESAETNLQAQETRFVDSAKINAVLDKVGGFKKPEYSKFINPTNIEIDENGSITPESLRAEVERVSQNYAELLNTSSTSQMPNNAAPKGKTSNDSTDLKDMTQNDLLALFNKSNK